ncbi:MAG TPA: DcaP family trimeric outer membrane transporter [Candidatus Eisenbacteria bacterium]|nr:DcaP family trimeric outer membrane transporter [Candidatus Eisenbacteria bacterium]
MKRALQPLLMAALVGGWVLSTHAAAQAQTTFDVYGFVMTDIGFNDIGVDPEWFDVQRPTKLPSFEDEFGDEGSAFFSVRQTRFGVKTTTPTDMGDLKTQFEWELFGTGVDAGQTTLRLRHAYGELGKFGAGQTWSPFMDIDVFPNTVEYWGPNGMVFFRNVQFRWMPIQGETRMTIALERPGASGDQGVYADKIDFAGITPRFPLPDLSAEFRKAFSRGYVELSGIVRKIEWEDLSGGPLDLSGDVTGWGVHVSSNLKIRPEDVLRLSFVYGEGIENYMNDAPVDVGTEPNPGDPITPIVGVALPVTGVVAFLDHNWNSQWATSVGYSMVEIDNSEGQAPDAFKKGQYMLANLMFMPVSSVMMGVEGGWIHRENNSDGFDVDQYHVQASFKYSFATTLGR